jgi:hypothetical protein
MAEAFQPKFADLVRNFTTTTGVNDFVLGPAVNGFASFVDACATGETFYYSALGVDNPGETEVGRGTLLDGGVIARDPVSGTKTAFTSGTKTIALVAAAEWFSAVDSARSTGGPTSVKSFGAMGDGVTDDTAAIQAALDQVGTSGGGALYFPEGEYVVSAPLSISPNTVLRGAGPMTTIISSAHAGGGGADPGEDLRNGSGFITVAPINASTPIHVVIEDIGIRNTNPDNVGAAYYDRGGTSISCRNCGFGGFKFGVVLEQSELVDVDLCEIGGQNDGGAAVWIVNGPDLTAGAASGYSNRISVKRCQINQYPTVYGIVDDGGMNHVVEDNNYNGCINHIRAAGAYPLDIRGGEFESAASHCIRLESLTLAGNPIGGGYTAIRGGSFTATSGHASVFSNTSGGLLQVDGMPLFSGGSGTHAITGSVNFAGIWLLSYSNLTNLPDLTDGNAQYVNINLGFAKLNGVTLQDGVVSASNIGSAAAHNESDFLQRASNLGDIGDPIAAAKNLQSSIVLAQSSVPKSHSGDTSEFTLATITIPAGAIGANGRVEVKAEFSYPSSTNSKTFKVKFGGTTVFSGGAGTTTSDTVSAYIANRGVSAQRYSAMHVNSAGTLATGTTPAGTAAVNTTGSVDIVITGTLASAAETLNLESYQVILYPKG